MDKLRYLSHIIANLAKKDLQQGIITQDFINKLNFIKGYLTPEGYVGIKQNASESLYSFVRMIYEVPRYQRGATFNEFFNEIANIIMKDFLARKPELITKDDVSTVERKVEMWFKSKVGSYQFSIPCAITRYFDKSFIISPISFTGFNNFLQSQGEYHRKTLEMTFEPFLQIMQAEAATWIATVEVSDCTKDRASEIEDLAVDLALTGLQIIIPLGFRPEGIARMTARKRPPYTLTVSISNGQLSSNAKNEEPGVGLDPSYIDRNAVILSSVGRRVESFLSGHSETPKLNQAWCDAAYWFHEGLAEPLDTITVPKLETAIEVLLRAESTTGSNKRLRKAIEVFYCKKENEIINPDSQLTVRQVC